MELSKWTILWAFYLSVIFTELINGMPTKSSFETDTNKRSLALTNGDDEYLKQETVEDTNPERNYELSEKLTTRRSIISSKVTTGSNFDDSKLGEDDLNIATESDDWTVTSNYEPIMGAEDTLGEQTTAEITEPPINLKPSSSVADVTTLITEEEEEELEEDLELFTESPTIESYSKQETSEIKEQEPAELRKLPNKIISRNSQDGKKETRFKTPNAEHDVSNNGIGTVFSLSDDFTDTHFAIDAAVAPSNHSVEDVPESETVTPGVIDLSKNLSTSTATSKTLSTSTTASKTFSTSTTPSKKLSTSTTTSKMLPETTTQVAVDSTVLVSGIRQVKKLPDGDGDVNIEKKPSLIPTITTSQILKNETVLEIDETIDLQLVASNVDEIVDALNTTSGLSSATTMVLTTTTSTTVRPSTRRLSTLRPNTSPRPTIRRRITAPMTTSTELSFLITSTTTEPVKSSQKFAPEPTVSSVPLNVDDDEEDGTSTTTAKPTTTTHRPPLTTTHTTTTTRKQFMVTVPPLEDDVTKSEGPYDEVEPEGSNVNLDSEEVNEENGTLSSTTHLNFNSLWSLFSVEATNAIIISGIIGGCAIIFFSILMVFCMWRQHISRRPNYPPTESSNCSSNSSASSFPASKSG